MYILATSSNIFDFQRDQVVVPSELAGIHGFGVAEYKFGDMPAHVLRLLLARFFYIHNGIHDCVHLFVFERLLVDCRFVIHRGHVAHELLIPG